jgi:tetratricopeptide (TPR) repeat protein
MKRIAFFIITCLCIPIVANSQSGGGSTQLNMNFEQYTKKVQKSDADIQDPKKSIAPKVWYNRGELMQEIYGLNGIRNSIQKGMEQVVAKMMFSEPKSVETTQLPNGATREKYVYDGYNLIFEGGKLVDWDQTRSILDRPLDKALESYMKANELDTEGKMTKKLVEKLNGAGTSSLTKEYLRDGIYLFEKGAQAEDEKDEAAATQKYNNAFLDFKGILAIYALPIINFKDTIYSYYAGFSAFKAKNYKGAIEYLEKACALNLQDASIYEYLATTYNLTGDTAKELETIKAGFMNLKENGRLVIQLVNFYLKTGDTKAALEYLNIAKKQDPSNKTLYFAEGTLADKIGDFEKSQIAYEKALEIDPNYFDATFNYGVLYFNRAVKMFDDAMMEKDNKIFATKKAAAELELKKAIPYMEKANELNPNDKQTLETLKTLYYRLQMNDKLEEVKQKLSTM